jgi:hypothetical protein
MLSPFPLLSRAFALFLDDLCDRILDLLVRKTCKRLLAHLLAHRVCRALPSNDSLVSFPNSIQAVSK